MSKKFIVISITTLLVGLLTIFIYVRHSSPDLLSIPLGPYQVNMTNGEDCHFDECCSTCYLEEEGPTFMCIACGRPPRYYSKGQNLCQKNEDGDACHIKLSLKSKIYKIWYRIFNID